MYDIEIARKAIEKFHGIRKDTPEDQVKRIWDSLSPEIQQAYLAKVTPPVRNKTTSSNGASKERKGKNAAGSGTKSEV